MSDDSFAADSKPLETDATVLQFLDDLGDENHNSLMGRRDTMMVLGKKMESSIDDS